MTTTAHLMCGCGHEKLVHGTGLPLYGSHDFACIMSTCDCPGFLEEPREALKRVRKVKTLDRPEPQLFAV